MVEELTNILIEEKKITKAALHLLLNGGQFRHLNLSMCAKMVTDDVIQIISAKCKVGGIYIMLFHCKIIPYRWKNGLMHLGILNPPLEDIKPGRGVTSIVTCTLCTTAAF